MTNIKKSKQRKTKISEVMETEQEEQIEKEGIQKKEINHAKNIVSQAIKDINSMVSRALKNNTVIIGDNGQKKDLLLKKIDNIAKNTMVQEAISVLGWKVPNELDKTVQLAITQINQLAKEQEQGRFHAEQVINQAIVEIQSIAESADSLNLIGEYGQRKTLLTQINIIKKKTEIQAAIKTLEWEEPNLLTKAVQESITHINQLAEQQQKETDARAEMQRKMLEEAKQVIAKTISDIKSIAESAKRLDLTKEDGQKKIIFEQIKSIINSEGVKNALVTLGWQYPNNFTNAIRVIVTQIKQEAAKQEELAKLKNALKMAKEDDFSSEAEKIELIELDKMGIDEALGKLREQDQGYGMLLGDRIKLRIGEQARLKEIIDDAVNPQKPISKLQMFDVNIANIQNLRVSPGSKKLKDVPVNIEQINGRILVKVGPCDLSGVGGHQVREQIIKDVVNQALKKAKIDKKYENVNVSATVSVRGRLQMVQGLFINNREDRAQHANAYIKTENETTLTHWEPRNGPQSFYNDTICAMVSATSTSLFEKAIRDNSIQSSEEATQKILKSSLLQEVFDHLLNITKNRIVELVEGIKTKFSTSKESEKGKDITTQYKQGIQKTKDIEADEEIDPGQTHECSKNAI